MGNAMEPANAEIRPARGRPRSEQAGVELLKAALGLLAERGYAGLTMEAIARRARVGKATLYRRWTSVEEVLAAAVGSLVSAIEVPDSGSLSSDLLFLMRQAVDLYRGPAGRVIPGLVEAMARHPAVARAVREGYLSARRGHLLHVLERGVARGELRPDIDFELALDLLGGPLFYRLLITGGPLDDRLARGTADLLIRGFGAGITTQGETT
jgi:AcrR family transcriptional regulator